MSFSALKLTWPCLPTTIWSWTWTPSGLAAFTISSVMAMSAEEGVGSPEGWLWTNL